jgi:putative transcriptional regulator
MAEVDRIPLVATTMGIDQTIQLLKKYSQYYAGE